MLTPEILSKVHMVHTFTTVNGRENKRVNLVFRTPDNRWVLSKLSTPDDNVKKIMGVRSPSGETTLFLNNPFMIANSLEELTANINSRLNLTANRQEVPLLPIDFEKYNEIIDKKNKAERITPDLVNDYFKAVGIDIHISSIKKRRNSSSYYIQLYTHNNEYQSFNLYRENSCKTLHDFVNGMLTHIITTLINRGRFSNRINIASTTCFNNQNVFASDTEEYILTCLRSMSSETNNDPVYDAYRRSIIRYRETFVQYDFAEKIMLDEFFNLIPVISQNGNKNLIDYGIGFDDFDLFHKPRLSKDDFLYYIESIKYYIKLEEKLIQLENIKTTFSNNVDRKIEQKISEVSNWYENIVNQLQQSAA